MRKLGMIAGLVAAFLCAEGVFAASATTQSPSMNKLTNAVKTGLKTANPSELASAASKKTTEVQPSSHPIEATAAPSPKPEDIEKNIAAMDEPEAPAVLAPGSRVVASNSPDEDFVILGKLDPDLEPAEKARARALSNEMAEDGPPTVLKAPLEVAAGITPVSPSKAITVAGPNIGATPKLGKKQQALTPAKAVVKVALKATALEKSALTPPPKAMAFLDKPVKPIDAIKEEADVVLTPATSTDATASAPLVRPVLVSAPKVEAEKIMHEPLSKPAVAVSPVMKKTAIVAALSKKTKHQTQAVTSLALKDVSHSTTLLAKPVLTPTSQKGLIAKQAVKPATAKLAIAAKTVSEKGLATRQTTAKPVIVKLAAKTKAAPQKALIAKQLTRPATVKLVAAAKPASHKVFAAKQVTKPVTIKLAATQKIIVKKGIASKQPTLKTRVVPSVTHSSTALQFASYHPPKAKMKSTLLGSSIKAASHSSSFKPVIKPFKASQVVASKKKSFKPVIKPYMPG